MEAKQPVEEIGSRSDKAESDDGHPEKGSEDHQTSAPNIQDLKLYNNVVEKIMKESLPERAEVSPQAQEVMRRLPTIFALFLTDRALAVTHKAKRRTLLPEDVVEALDANGFSAYRSKVIPVVEKRRSNFHKRGPKIKRTESSNPANEQAASEPSSEVNGEPAKDVSEKENSESDQDDRKEDQNEATMEEESSEDDADGAEDMDQESASGEDEDVVEDEENSHHASISSRPTDPPPSDTVTDGRDKEDDESSSDSMED